MKNHKFNTIIYESWYKFHIRVITHYNCNLHCRKKKLYFRALENKLMYFILTNFCDSRKSNALCIQKTRNNNFLLLKFWLIFIKYFCYSIHVNQEFVDSSMNDIALWKKNYTERTPYNRIIHESFFEKNKTKQTIEGLFTQTFHKNCDSTILSVFHVNSHDFIRDFISLSGRFIPILN